MDKWVIIHPTHLWPNPPICHPQSWSTNLVEDFVNLDPIIQNFESKEKRNKGFPSSMVKKVQCFINNWQIFTPIAHKFWPSKSRNYKSHMYLNLRALGPKTCQSDLNLGPYSLHPTSFYTCRVTTIPRMRGGMSIWFLIFKYCVKIVSTIK